MPSKKRFFVHIEKAGGTSMHHALMSYTNTYRVLPPLKKGHGWRYDHATLSKLSFLVNNYEFIGGHQVSSIPHDQFKNENIQYFTFMREPISRYISHVNWLLNTTNKYTKEQLLEGENLVNIQCFRICAEKNFEAAKKHLLEREYFVGLMEHFDESIYLLSKWLDDKKWVYYTKKNAMEAKDKVVVQSELSQTQMDRVIRKNEEDIKLYEFVAEELYKRQKQQLSYNEGEFEKWKEQNMQFHLSSFIIFKRKLFNFLIRRFA